MLKQAKFSGRGPDPCRPEPERPVVAWDRLILREQDAAEFLKLPPSTFRGKAASGEFDRHREEMFGAE